MGILILFVDGVGIGSDDPGRNPFSAIRARRLAPVRGLPPEDGGVAGRLEATLGVPGLPQSATGQTTLFTGVNAARVMGRHFQGIPGPTLLPILARESMFLKLVKLGRRPTFANGYTRAHLEARRPRWSATTRMVQASGVALRMIDGDETDGGGLIHDYTGEWAVRHGVTVPRRSPDQAADLLAAHLDDRDVVLYEYFLTDLIGHRGTWDDKIVQARRVEDLVDAVVRRTELDRHVVVMVSDHGNLEEGDHRRHTLSPVPLLAWGAGADRFVISARTMEAFTPTVVRFHEEGHAARRKK